MTNEDKASYYSTPPCKNTVTFYNIFISASPPRARDLQSLCTVHLVVKRLSNISSSTSTNLLRNMRSKSLSKVRLHRTFGSKVIYENVARISSFPHWLCNMSAKKFSQVRLDSQSGKTLPKKESFFFEKKSFIFLESSLQSSFSLHTVSIEKK